MQICLQRDVGRFRRGMAGRLVLSLSPKLWLAEFKLPPRHAGGRLQYVYEEVPNDSFDTIDEEIHPISGPDHPRVHG